MGPLKFQTTFLFFWYFQIYCMMTAVFSDIVLFSTNPSLCSRGWLLRVERSTWSNPSSRQRTRPGQRGGREPRGAPMWSTSARRFAISTRANPVESLVRAGDILGFFSSSSSVQTWRSKPPQAYLHSSQLHKIVVVSEFPLALGCDAVCVAGRCWESISMFIKVYSKNAEPALYRWCSQASFSCKAIWMIICWSVPKNDKCT